MHLTVTQQDLELAVINSSTSDPLCLAAMRAGLKDPAVLNRHTLIYTDEQGIRRKTPLPDIAIRFLDTLRYKDRHEMLRLVRSKNDSFYHEPFQFSLGVGSTVAPERAAA